MTSSRAIKFVVSSSKHTLGAIHLQCHVKPGASKQREGVVAITEEVIDLCVAAQAREGEANKAVRNVISKVLKVPKSDVEVIKGHKSRDKTVAIVGFDPTGNEEDITARVKEQLQNSLES